MKDLIMKIQKFEFEARIFVSFSIVIFVCMLSFSIFAQSPANTVIFGRMAGISAGTSLSAGYLVVSFFVLAASVLRMWSGSVLTSNRMMAFRIQDDSLLIKGPYLLVRNPIYLADLFAFTGFSLVLPPIGLLLPVLLYLHYTQLIKYEELSLEKQFEEQYRDYRSRVPQLIPNLRSLRSLAVVFKDFKINQDGFRHNAVYLLFIPGFILTSFTHNIFHAIVLGAPSVLDWAIIHTKIGLAKKTPCRDLEKAESQKNKLSKKKVFKDILYAQCWEDPQIDRAAFKINSDDVIFSITSGGCNALAFLIDNPKKLIALDINPQQNFLLDLKISAFKKLSYEELLEFLGVKESNNRLHLYNRIRPLLQINSARYWDGNMKKIEKGIIHSGRYEGYMRLLKKAILTPLIRNGIIEKLFKTEDTTERTELFLKKWKNFRWWLLTHILLSRRMNTLFFDKAFFTYLEKKHSLGNHFAQKAERAITELPMKKNYFLSYILLGRYYSNEYLPPYLRRENFETIRSRLDRIIVVTDSCENFFSILPDSYISKFNFTNIFEWMSPEAYEDLLKETIRVAKNGAIMTYRNLLVFREHPASLEENIQSLRELAKSLHQQDLSFIYNNYIVEEIHKREGK